MASEVAQNQAAGQFTNLGLGVGTMAGVGGAVGGMVGNMMGNVLNPADQVSEPPVYAAMPCVNCGKPLPKQAKFCLECGAKVENHNDQEMTCSVCGKVTVKGKYCVECGALLVSQCPECSAQLPNGAKFCLQCGHKIEV